MAISRIPSAAPRMPIMIVYGAEPPWVRLLTPGQIKRGLWLSKSQRARRATGPLSLGTREIHKYANSYGGIAFQLDKHKKPRVNLAVVVFKHFGFDHMMARTK